MKGTSCALVVSKNTTDIIGMVNREENLELAQVDKCMDDCRGRGGVDGQGYWLRVQKNKKA